jgi:hypothetical protein
VVLRFVVLRFAGFVVLLAGLLRSEPQVMAANLI